MAVQLGVSALVWRKQTELGSVETEIRLGEGILRTKSDWARDSSLARSRLPWFLGETAREAGLMKGNGNTLKPGQHKLQL